MGKTTTLFLVGLTLAVMSSARIVAAQSPAAGQTSRYSPPSGKPTVSPYLNLFRRDSGPLPNYQTLVRPQLNQLETNKMLRMGVDHNASNLQQVEQKVTKLRQPQMGATGTGGGFNTFSHFYSQQR